MLRSWGVGQQRLNCGMTGGFRSVRVWPRRRSSSWQASVSSWFWSRAGIRRGGLMRLKLACMATDKGRCRCTDGTAPKI